MRKETFTDPNLSLVDKSMENSDFIVNLDTIDPSSDSITNFLDKYIMKKQIKHTNNNTSELPIIGNSTISSYNHQLRILNNSKQIKQDFILNALKGNINFLLESLKDLEKK
tara:strand:+ start:129 stop:461 length:333 start_codon:yes stop_codon:yes gene_type:complete